MNKKLVAGAVLLTLAGIVTVGAVVVDITLLTRAHFNWNVQYQKAIHSHMDNAYYADTPDLMKKELLLAEKGMHAEGLDGYYDSVYAPHQTPDHHMDYQFAHLDSVVARCDDVIKWRDASSQGTQATDVYEAKMQALRHFIKNDGGWSDNIAQGAYFVKNHPAVSFWWDYGVWIFLGWIVLMLALCITGGVLVNFGLNDNANGNSYSRYA